MTRAVLILAALAAVAAWGIPAAMNAAARNMLGGTE